MRETQRSPRHGTLAATPVAMTRRVAESSSGWLNVRCVDPQPRRRPQLGCPEPSLHMLRSLSIVLLTAGVAAFAALRSGSQHVHAYESGEVLLDSDDDFLPDCVEWATLTSATNPDTDADQVPDFVEVVQRGTPRLPGEPLPLDQEMRILITGPQLGTGASTTWMHLFVRLIEPSASVASFQAWLEIAALPGLRCPFDMFALGPAVYRQRDAGAQGKWIQLSVPLVSHHLLASVLPGSIQAEALVGGRYIRSGVSLFRQYDTIATLAPFGKESYAVQTIAPLAGGGGITNRVCVLSLEEQVSTPAGTLYCVTGADCEDCSELECVLTNCAQSIGWQISIPGGLGVIGGSN
jgi:hypothetical protein